MCERMENENVRKIFSTWHFIHSHRPRFFRLQRNFTRNPSTDCKTLRNHEKRIKIKNLWVTLFFVSYIFKDKIFKTAREFIEFLCLHFLSLFRSSSLTTALKKTSQNFFHMIYAANSHALLTLFHYVCHRFYCVCVIASALQNLLFLERREKEILSQHSTHTNTPTRYRFHSAKMNNTARSRQFSVQFRSLLGRIIIWISHGLARFLKADLKVKA